LVYYNHDSFHFRHVLLNGYEWKKREKDVISKAARVSVPSVGVVPGPAASDGLLGIGGMVDLSLSPVGGFFFLGFFCVSF
jgi:hypothetical protein